jgi:FkbM family methyltransferase
MESDEPTLRPRPGIVRAFLGYYARRRRLRGRDVVCFQVGANDGKANDPLYPYLRDYDWSGLLVEPLPDVFENELRTTYADRPRVKLANVAIAPKVGRLPFYRVAVSRARWATGLSSFRRDTVQRHVDNGYIEQKAREYGVALPDDPAEIVEEIEVPTTTVDQLLTDHGIDDFDILCIDTEGYDAEVLKLVDIERYRPEVIVFESKNLSHQDRGDALSRLKACGYALYADRGDVLATTIPFPWTARIATALGQRARRARRVISAGLGRIARRRSSPA